MRFLKRKLGPWTVPVVLSVVLASGLAISPAVGALNFVTGKKLNKTIRTKTNAVELRVTGQRLTGNTFNLDAPDSLMASQNLRPGHWVVTTTFSLTRDTGALVVNCELRAGSRKDAANAFGGGAQLQDNVGMSTTAFIPEGGSAELRCGDGSPAVDSRLTNIEITALKVPVSANRVIP